MIFTAPTSTFFSFQSAFFEITAMGEKQTNPPHPKKSNQPTKKDLKNPIPNPQMQLHNKTKGKRNPLKIHLKNCHKPAKSPLRISLARRDCHHTGCHSVETRYFSVLGAMTLPERAEGGGYTIDARERSEQRS